MDALCLFLSAFQTKKSVLVLSIPLYRYVNISLLIHQFMDFGLFTAFWQGESIVCCEHLWMSFLWLYVFMSLGCIPKSRIAGSYCNSIFNSWGELLNCVPRQQQHLAFSLIVWFFNLSTSCATLVTVNFNHLSGSEGVSSSDFDLYFHDVWW